MNNHVSQWLNAYHDDELRPRRRALVEAHLEQCPQCQAELSELQEISSLLAAQPLPELRTTPEEFTAQVALRLPRQVNRRNNGLNFNLRTFWYTIPVTLLAAIAFLRIIVTVTGMLNVIELLGINANPVSWLVPPAQTSPGLLQQATSALFGWSVPFNSSLSYTLILPVIFSACYLIWLLMWWADQNQTEINGEKAHR
jgi:predicted anti-sigma-YlaC factor YlaD